MINPNLYKTAVAVDTIKHRTLRLAHAVEDWSIAADINAMFLATVEFADACCEYPIFFINAGTDEQGKQLVAPVAVFGLTDKQNLYVKAGQWRVQYMPALLRAYPFGIARQDENRVVVVIDEAYKGWSASAGEAIFDAQGEATPFMSGMRDQLEKIENEIQRTRLFGALLVEHKLLSNMRFEATLPDGKKLQVEGFLTVDEAKMAALPDATVLEFHKSGVLGLLHAHQISMRHMRRLVEWHVAALLGVSPPQA